MRRLSSIFNFRDHGRRAAVFGFSVLIAVFLCDRAAFSVFFPLYDQWLRVGSALTGTEILLVGSSHIQADVDLKLLREMTNETVGMFSVPGAGLTPRYYAIKERLELKDVAKPKVIVLETSKMVFHPDRYTDDVSDYLIAYRNKGFFKDYVNRYAPAHRGWPWYQVFESYSLNGGFDKFTEPGNIFRFITENALSVKNYLRLRSYFRGPETSCLTDGGSDASDLRIGEWERFRKANGFDSRIDPNKIATLMKIAELTRQYDVRLILLDPPYYVPSDDSEESGYQAAKSILKKMASPGISYVRPEVPNRSCLFNDEGHLSNEGQQMLTAELAKEI